MTASIATYPHEVVRTRLQTLRLPIAEDLSSDGMIKAHTKRSIIYITRKIVQKEGWSGLYKGLSVNLFRTVPNSAVTLLSCVIRSKNDRGCDVTPDLDTSSSCAICPRPDEPPIPSTDTFFFPRHPRPFRRDRQA